MNGSELDGDVDIHPSAVIGRHVVIGPGSSIGPFAVIGGTCSLGAGAWIGPGAVIGAPPEIRGRSLASRWWDAESDFGVFLGDHVVVREGVHIQAGSVGNTEVGDECYIMSHAYVAHDCRLGEGVTISSTATLAGHVVIGRLATIGMGAAIHQRRSVGAYAMVGMSSAVTHDIPPFVIAYGAPARPARANEVGMQRSGFTPREIEWVDNWVTSGAHTDPRPLTERLRAEF